jgi:hypothetical protein
LTALRLDLRGLRSKTPTLADSSQQLQFAHSRSKFPLSRVSRTHQQAQICGRLKGNRYFEDSHERIKPYFRLNESQCAQREYREWTPDCNEWMLSIDRHMASIEGIGEVDQRIPCMQPVEQDPIISATSRSAGRHECHSSSFRMLSFCSILILS